jgi:hypothetical protein
MVMRTSLQDLLTEVPKTFSGLCRDVLYNFFKAHQKEAFKTRQKLVRNGILSFSVKSMIYNTGFVERFSQSLRLSKLCSRLLI